MVDVVISYQGEEDIPPDPLTGEPSPIIDLDMPGGTEPEKEVCRMEEEATGNTVAVPEI
ncbi:OLC1v1027431C1 [Oldenlandia corymbosa var. corymbosa]|uniref:OLC1v1027431C1 n=1 Tax=Oldenlandia corymbosa var. corymbosa TaxID=529605 RepID=A0AAV1C9G9_OLDCO|nr:OLC1v1027431C1 [Oldenlandia corymbosa var. corymbosa]